MLYLGALVALALVALFAGGEAAFATANRLRVETHAQQGSRAARLARLFLREPAALLATALAGRTVALVGFATLLALALDPALTAVWARVLAPGPAGTAALLTEIAGAATLMLLLGEVLPRALLREPPERAVLALAPPLRLTRGLLLPLVRLAGGVAQRNAAHVLRERHGATALDLDEEETEILESVLELRTLRVRDSMVPRTDVRAVEEGADLEVVRRAFVESGFSRLPVYRESLDHIVGVVLAHDLFHDPPSLAAVTRPVVFVPESKPARDFLFEVLRDGTTFAVVLDEYGGTAGIVTVEDLLEELFGDIRDEHDAAAALLRRLDERTFLAAGRARLEDLHEAFGLALPEGDYDTVAGYLLDRVGTVPEPRERFEFDGLRFTVLEATANRIITVRIQTPAE